MIEFATKAFVTFFVLIDPIGLIPLFLGLVGVRSYQEQKKIALRSTLVAGLLVLGFALLGGAVLRYLGISLEALKVAGGLLLFKIALDMINAQLERETDEEQAESRLRTDVSVFPLAIPLIAGPGTLASVLILTGTAPGGLGLPGGAGHGGFGLVHHLLVAQGCAQVLQPAGAHRHQCYHPYSGDLAGGPSGAVCGRRGAGAAKASLMQPPL